MRKTLILAFLFVAIAAASAGGYYQHLRSDRVDRIETAMIRANSCITQSEAAARSGDLQESRRKLHEADELMQWLKLQSPGEVREARKHVPATQ